MIDGLVYLGIVAAVAVIGSGACTVLHWWDRPKRRPLPRSDTVRERPERL